ncbi:PTS transporter subunit EIIC [Lactiplantibacillus fabifermentans]|uniref:Permease IIC component n=1 Tax=Lactiplantibacillus fabifermentans DSM 21115 TaxID=1413187 RepID=A0A0R2NRX5_9LACO|nr:PTS transporter subunit EIIC [Lactiplantibacillus fabifermentans]KRO28431.1 cellobiose PTS, EIIC [Lactiplantibacillus fabifermentans DSM 21115]
MGLSEQQIINRLVPTLLRLRQTNFYRVIQRTVMLTFPFVLIGSFSAIIEQTVLTKTGFLASIFHLSKWVPYYRYLHYPFDNLTNLTLDSVAIIAAFGAAKYHAKLHHRDDQLSGLTGAIALLLIAYQYTDQAQNGLFNALLLGTNGLTGGIIIGSLTGWYFQLFSKPTNIVQKTHAAEILDRTFHSLLPMLMTMLTALVISIGMHYLSVMSYSEESWAQFQKIATTSHSLWLTFGMAALTLLLELFGLAGPYQQRLVTNSPAMTTNLNTALSQHSAYHVPYPFTANTLYDAFGTFGGTGMLLALVIAIYVASHNHNYHVVARWSMLPALFNANGPMLTGLPVLYNPIYLIPFICAPLLNMAVAALAISWHWMPPMVYPVPIGTPGPLIAFIGTDGNWVALVIGLVCLALSVAIYMPFMRLSEAILHAAHEESLRSEMTADEN